MKAPVSFNHVSKRYRLGTWRASLREALSLPSFSRGTAQAEENCEPSFLWALRDVSFEVPKGHALGIVGPNGAGKTTILKLLTNISKPTSGRIKVRGRISSLIELGAGFHPDLTGRENIYLNGAILGMRRKETERLFDQIVSFSGLERFIDTPVKRYSSGMYVRLGFSVAAHVQPDVLLVDEVLAVGDTQFRQRCAKRIEWLREAGTTIVFVAHNLHLVRSVCDMAAFLVAGKIQSQGNVVETIKAYEDWCQTAQVNQVTEDNLSKTDSYGTSEVDIERVEVRAWGRATRAALAHSDAVEIRVHFSAAERVFEPNLVLLIRRADGPTCCMVRTRDYGLSLEHLEG